ncbi:MAG: hypothetical protein KGL95_05400 [Patescibacteria group bacterium]|nr:hypothetical protein [Patescibacteria group bacterium]
MEKEDHTLPIKLTEEFMTWASKERRNATECEQFVKQYEKISPEYRFKVFYNISIKINELQRKQ